MTLTWNDGYDDALSDSDWRGGEGNGSLDWNEDYAKGWSAGCRAFDALDEEAAS